MHQFSIPGVPVTVDIKSLLVQLASFRAVLVGTPATHFGLFPYLLRDMTIERPNQVWATDITYTAVSGHRAFVIGIIDLFSRKVMAYNVVNTMDAWYCVETLQEAVRRYGRPEIFNSDQGSQFTSAEFIRELKENGIRISMDGRGRCLDRVVNS